MEFDCICYWLLYPFKFTLSLFDYCNDPKFSDRQVSADSVDPDQTAPSLLKEQFDQGLHCLVFVIQSASFGRINLWLNHIIQF